MSDKETTAPRWGHMETAWQRAWRDAKPWRSAWREATVALVAGFISAALSASSGATFRSAAEIVLISVGGAALAVPLGAHLLAWAMAPTRILREEAITRAQHAHDMEQRIADTRQAPTLRELANEADNLASEIAQFLAAGPITVEHHPHPATPRENAYYRQESDEEYQARFQALFFTRLRSLFSDLRREGLASEADGNTFYEPDSQMVASDLRRFAQMARERQGS